MMKQKKLMLLGGLRYLLPVIEEAHKLGVHVITADYLPDNFAHKYSDEYCNVSIIDKEAVLKVAQQLEIDGILSHAVDPGVVSAAYVAEQMGLPFQCSYKTACILQDKSLFRKFLAENGFNCPHAKGYNNAEAALKDVDYFEWPVIVKPVDSAGSKGVTKVEDPKNLQQAIDTALASSISKNFIIEDFLEKEGFSVGSESFVVDGKLLYNGFYDQYFNDEATNPYTPSAEVWPSVMKKEYQEEIKSELQRLVTLLGIAMLVRFQQSKKAASPILVTLSGIVTELSFMQFENALSPIYVTPESIITLVIASFPCKPLFQGASSSKS